MLEVCVDSLESAIAAECGGADRLELCANLVIGGTTPSVAFYQQVRQAVQIPIHILIRPRFGDFLYSLAEIDRMQAEIQKLAEAGAKTFVIGALTAAGELDEPALKKLMAAAPKARFALHRAFDMTENLEKALYQAIDLGFSCILTSGGAASARQGAARLRHLQELASGRIEIMAGAGITADNLAAVMAESKVSIYHLSGKKTRASAMRYRNLDVFMGLPGMSEYENYVTDAEEISKAVKILKA
ncbi:copper homeostasis protein CutC [Clostridiales bacterium COT073_COT-073]|nr:copper homeostasis protein CutC [Clostridiales bacterium COT073_COT-073]